MQYILFQAIVPGICGNLAEECEVLRSATRHLELTSSILVKVLLLCALLTFINSGLCNERRHGLVDPFCHALSYFSLLLALPHPALNFSADQC